MPFFKPAALPYDIQEWRKQSWNNRVKMACQAWAIQGYGAPFMVYGFYLLKIAFYVWAWAFFCSFTAGLGDIWNITSFCFEPIAFQKAILWSMAFEGLGLGCASGPMTGRYHPIVGGFLHFLRPGTIKRPLFPRLAVFGQPKRTWLDVTLYALHYIFLFRALTAPELTFETILPIVILLPVLGLTDKTIFLCSRAEHYYTTTVCFLFGTEWIAGAMAVQLAIWWWAATSKLNHHFPAVIATMTSNNPFIPFEGVRKRMYRNYPNDLRPSNLARLTAHSGTLMEFTFPVLLALGTGGSFTTWGLTLMLLMHLYIMSNIPMAVPLEWNVHVIYGAFFLFGHHAEWSVFDLQSPLLITYLVIALIAVPIIGNLYPRFVSFLLSMRYYAGNWAYSVWLFRKEGETYRKLDKHITKAARWVPDQLAMFYDQDTVDGLLGKIPAFRSMHIHGRALQLLLPEAVNSIDDYEYVEGEVIAGLVLGWNFGDGHLHDEPLLETLQNECQFEAGELICIFVESQPFLGQGHQYRIVDAKSGLMRHGMVSISDLIERQPWAPEEPANPLG